MRSGTIARWWAGDRDEHCGQASAFLFCIQMFDDRIGSVHPTKRSATGRAFDIAALLEVSGNQRVQRSNARLSSSHAVLPSDLHQPPVQGVGEDESDHQAKRRDAPEGRRIGLGRKGDDVRPHEFHDQAHA